MTMSVNNPVVVKTGSLAQDCGTDIANALELPKSSPK